MFPWQLKCLRTGNVLAGAGNLVYSAPTSAGKTLVAEILMLKRILETKTKAFLVLPFVSLAREKELVLAELFGGCGVRVGGFLGQRRPPGGLSGVDLAVCTIERANNLLNGMLLDQGSLGELGILVVDELHLVGDAHRGYLLELMLTKVAYAQKRGLVGPRGVQVVAMSATLSNLSALAKWLSADLYQTDFRPVPLRQLFKLGQDLCEGPDLRPVHRLPAGASDDPEGLLALCLETWAEGHALLVFCPTRRWCEALAASLARTLQQLVTGTDNPGLPRRELAEKLRSRISAETGQHLVERLRSTPGAMDPALASCLSMQVAFHHAGLTMEERDLLESAFREGTIRVLVATTTLSSGVNLPARRVIIRSANFQGRPIDSLSYHQMVGRAGRMGLDTQGESILMCRDVDRPLAQRLSRAEAQPITSCLSGSSTSLRRALLEVVASGVASKPEELCLYTECTLRHQLCTGGGAKEDLDGALQFLVDHQLVHLQGEDGDRRYCPSQLGRAVLASGLSPDDALSMVGELERARRCLALDSDLHLVYLVTPGHLGAQLSSDESSPVAEYSSVSSLVLEQVLRFRDELAKGDLWPDSAAEGSASTAIRQ
ncbi:DNA polymerase theta [Rhipicephalus sanguineus]|uniref:DNA polymerase theta n=1 Tax=Rhipicephalus sanguineus TaxID=34632 RepID=UPI0020C3C391|nr:DNA polymerase theta [Rhipicephalus sanguineus]